jgi:hypothetical protein
MVVMEAARDLLERNTRRRQEGTISRVVEGRKREVRECGRGRGRQ